MAENKLPMSRRLHLAVIILISQMLLMALAIAWLVHMILIAVNGSVYFIEDNNLVLSLEIAASVLITLFGLWVLFLQLQRLGERRETDRREGPIPERRNLSMHLKPSQQRQRQSPDDGAVNGKGI
jgi:ABC-type nickel/cobalt efflux system permease component RcnA